MTFGPDILGRIIQPADGDLPPEVARYVLSLGFPKSDQERISHLSDKAQQGTLTEAEQSDLDGYLFINDFLTILQSKARMSLRRPAGRRIA